jgi:hypothetical protein
MERSGWHRYAMRVHFMGVMRRDEGCRSTASLQAVMATPSGQMC